MPGPSEGDEPFARSMTDLMAGVAVTFLLIAAIFIVRAQRETKAVQDSAHLKDEQAKELEDLKSQNRQVILELAKLAGELDPKLPGADVGALDESRIEPNDPFVLTLVLKRHSVRFGEGACELEAAANAALAALAHAVLPKVCDAVEKGTVQTIALEGHTDNHGYFPTQAQCGVAASIGCTPESRNPRCVALGFENNVQLSAARAQHVFFHVDHLLGERDTKDANRLMRCLEDHFTVAGRGPVEPIEGSSWKEAQDDKAVREANRRVVIKLRALARPPALDAGAE
jgi:outer membrane protein OmpA-like peptidoglycan-associated protein